MSYSKLTRKDISTDTDLRRKLDVGEQEGAEKLGEGALPEPSVDGVKDKFVATVCVSSKIVSASF
jgi:hypothetical protein